MVEKNLDFTIGITKRKNWVKLIKKKTKGTTIDNDIMLQVFHLRNSICKEEYNNNCKELKKKGGRKY